MFHVLAGVGYAIDQSSVTVIVEFEKLAVSPLDMTLLMFKVAQYSKFPEVDASKIPIATIVPQSAVAVGNVNVVPFDFEVGLVPLAFGQLVGLLVTENLAYAVPDVETSVPPPESEGAEVNRATKTVTGGVNAVAPKT
jgi:hypothetical protein